MKQGNRRIFSNISLFSIALDCTKQPVEALLIPRLFRRLYQDRPWVLPAHHASRPAPEQIWFCGNEGCNKAVCSKNKCSVKDQASTDDDIVESTAKFSLIGEKVSKRGSRIPRKLKHDAIIESVIEMRFETRTKPEFLLVRLNEMEAWKDFKESRLPAFGIPEQLREVDPNLRFQPIFELQRDQRSLRIGPRVVSYHLRHPYQGWAIFGKEVERVVEAVFLKAEGVVIKRLGLRYLNALTSDVHQVRGAGDLDVSVVIGTETVSDEININRTLTVSNDKRCTVKIATPSFVTGSLPPNTTVLADIDVFTPDSFETRDQNVVKRWVEEAHITEKQEFFVLLKGETIDFLEET